MADAETRGGKPAETIVNMGSLRVLKSQVPSRLQLDLATLDTIG